MKWIFIVLAVGLVAVVARRAMARFGAQEGSMYPDQDKYEQTDNPKSAVIVASGMNVSEVEYSVNSETHFLWSTAYDEEGITRQEDRWFGIDHIAKGDFICFRVSTKDGKRVDGKLTIPSIGKTH